MWYSKLLSLPYEKGADGPDKFDCWGLVRHVQSKYFCVDLPIVDVDRFDKTDMKAVLKDHQLNHTWRPLTDEDEVKEGDVAVLANCEDAMHVGVVVKDVHNRLCILHSVEEMGVVLTSFYELAPAGWNYRKIYRWQE